MPVPPTAVLPPKRSGPLCQPQIQCLEALQYRSLSRAGSLAHAFITSASRLRAMSMYIALGKT